MKTYARIGMFETNSSTHNQIAIYMAKDMVRHKDIDPIIIKGSFDDATHETYFDTQSKINIIYALIRGVATERDYYAAIADKYDSDFAKEEVESLNEEMQQAAEFEKFFFSVLEKHHIEYTIDSDTDWSK